MDTRSSEGYGPCHLCGAEEEDRHGAILRGGCECGVHTFEVCGECAEHPPETCPDALRYREFAARMRASGKHASAESWERAARELETGRAE